MKSHPPFKLRIAGELKTTFQLVMQQVLVKKLLKNRITQQTDLASFCTSLKTI